MRTAIVALAPVATVVAIASILPFVARASSGHDFDAVVTAVSSRYSAHLQEAPLMGLVSLCARSVTADGVGGMRVAQFDSFRQPPDGAELDRLVSGALGPGWLRIVATHSRDGDTTLIFSQPDGQGMRLIVADYENGELDLVRAEVNGQQMQRWLQHPRGSVQWHHDAKSAIPD